MYGKFCGCLEKHHTESTPIEASRHGGTGFSVRSSRFSDAPDMLHVRLTQIHFFFW